MELNTWIIPEDYKSDKHLGDGLFEGDCVYVLAVDKEKKLIFCWTGHAFSYTKTISMDDAAIINGNDSAYYYEILNEMIPVSKDYFRPTIGNTTYFRKYIEEIIKGHFQTRILRFL